MRLSAFAVKTSPSSENLSCFSTTIHPISSTPGSANPIFDPVPLQAGNLSMLYKGGFLRYIECGEVEVVRMINHLVRDQNRTTIPMEIITEQVERMPAGDIET